VELLDEEFMVESWKEAGIYTFAPFICNKSPETFLEELSFFVEPLIKQGKFIISIGGEHSITEGILMSLSKQKNELSVLDMDAHADLRLQYQGSIYNHACSARRMSQYAKVVQIGVRSISEDEYTYCNKGRVKTFFMHKHRDINALLRGVLRELTDNVYISIDMDCLDPSIAPAVGTPVPGGFTWFEVIDIIRTIIREKNVLSCDVVELCPNEASIVSEFTAAKLIYKIISYVNEKIKGRL
jgi:agmatinase